MTSQKVFGKGLIINADDFGINSNVNAAIMECFAKDLINSTSLMANMEGFDEAVQLAFEHGLTDRIGLHINLTEGRPLTDLSGTGLTDKYGNFIMGAVWKVRLAFSPNTRKKIKNEITAQYEKILAAGIDPSHFDSHQHVHILPWLAPLITDFARSKNKKLRIVTVVRRRNFFLIFYNVLLNRYFKSQKVNFSDIFGNAGFFERYLKSEKSVEPLFEVMVHPAIYKEKLVEINANLDLEKRINVLKNSYLKKLS